MPELPEVETIARELQAVLPGRGVRRVRIFRKDALQGVPVARFQKGLEGRRFQAVRRRGKYLLFHLKPEAWLVAHLRMTGKFALTPRPDAPPLHHRVWFELDDGAVLAFQDLRCLGTLELAGAPEAVPGVAAMGVEPLEPGFTRDWLAQALSRSRAPLKHWLMHQGHIAGLGNIYVAEILFGAGLSPLRAAATVTREEAARLHQAVRRVLMRAIAKNGTTISDYRRVDDKTGDFQNFLRVYGRAGQPCHTCRTPIQRVVQQQRSTFYCPTCQR
ncbi:MAG: bifunctional DNA-formamidopyrimidine glycosylase/DNA-(apurinic or apyrimidinic site) lyase [Deltaproteobacteria bacterium]|nr:bifunctional DNA-formamidopyrimidine glycosylase/DNA-(apurinic or apyrimidinic site) lyase [Deltaproteobacteria bacterium]